MVTIKEVLTRKERRQFADFPNHLYRGVPQYVPGFLSDDISDWDPRKNPAAVYCDFKCFLAYKDGKIVGRIGAILSHRANEKWHTNRMRFSCVDFIDDTEATGFFDFAFHFLGFGTVHVVVLDYGFHLFDALCYKFFIVASTVLAEQVFEHKCRHRQVAFY